MRGNLLILICLVLCLILLSSCAPGVNGRSEDNRAGFFMGIWHGWIAPVTLIWQIFNHNVRVYDVYNTGWWYDFGFYIAIVGGFGCVAFSRKRKRR
jgi:hypothetical protein